MGRSIIIIATVLSCLWRPISAQQADGNLEGLIVDATGQPLPDARVVASGPSLQGTRGIATDRDGYFRLQALPAGSYTLRISHVAHQATTYENVQVRLGATTSLGKLSLEQAVLEQPRVVVSAGRPPIDPATTTLGMNLRAGTFEALPTDRNFRSIVALAPQANSSVPGEEASIAGSTGEGNYYFIDGTDATDPGSGGTSTNLPYNFVRELDIKTGGYEAEYGRALGGIVNAITKSGGNELHGQVFGYFTDHRLASTTQNALRQAPAGNFSAYDFGGSLGGPVVRDRLWWFGAYNPAFDERDVQVPGIPLQKATSRLHRIAGKLTWRATSRTNLNLIILGDPSRSRLIGVPFNLASPPALVLNEDAVVATTLGGGVNISMNGVHQLMPKVLLQGAMMRVHNRSFVQPISERGATEPYVDDQENSTASGGYGGENKNYQDRWAGRLAATAFLGRHTTKVGLEYTDNSITNDIQYGAGKAHRGFLYRSNDSVYTWYQGFQLGTVHVRLPTAYAQDSWRVTDRLRINAGLRWDGHRYVSSNGSTPLKTEGLQPRLGVTYQLGAVGSQKLSASFGRYYEQLPANSPGYYFFDSIQLFIGYDHDPRVDPSGGDTTKLLPNPPGGGRIRGEHFDEVTLGYERALPRQVKLGVHGRYRTLREVVEDSYSPVAQRFLIGNPGHGALDYLPEATHDYRALELTLQKLGEGRGEFLLSYVLSRTKGNYAGLVYGNGGPQFDFVETTVNAFGPLPNDRPHVVKFYGAYPVGFGLTAGTTWVWQSGTPVSELGGIPGLPYAAFLRPRGSAGRTPSIWDLNLRLTYDAPAVRAARPKLVLDLFHVFSRRRAILLDERRYFAADASGNQVGLNTDYLRPTLHQPPFSARLGAAIEF